MKNSGYSWRKKKYPSATTPNTSNINTTNITTNITTITVITVITIVRALYHISSLLPSS